MDECATTIAVHGERDRLYALAAAVPRWAEFLPHYRWTRPAAPSEDGAAADLDMACWRGWVPLRWRTTVTADPATHRVHFVHTGGGARGMQVEWRLVEQAGTTTATITHDLRGLAQWPATTTPGRYLLTRHLIEPVARRTLAMMKTLVEAGATGPDTAVALAADPAGPLPARDDPRAGLLSWLPWALWLGTSVIWSRWSRRTLAASGESRRREEPAGAWRGHLAAFAATFALLAPAIPAGPLDRPFPLGWWSRRAPALGLAVEVGGFGLAFWARLTLGRYCTARVAVASGQPLVQHGPYGMVRHPLYTGLLLGVLGQALVLGRWRGLAALATLARAYRRKAGYEEAALRRHFGAEWETYTATVPAFLPRRRRTASRPGSSDAERDSR